MATHLYPQLFCNALYVFKNQISVSYIIDKPVSLFAIFVTSKAANFIDIFLFGFWIHWSSSNFSATTL